MKKSIKTIITIATMGIMLVSAYFLGTTQAETVTKVQTVTEIKEVIPGGYIDTTTEDFQNNYLDLNTVSSYTGTSNGLQLYTSDGNGYCLDIAKDQDTTQFYYIGSESDFDILLDALENRNGKIIIEVITGTVEDAEGNGTDINGYYVKYDNTRFSEGDKVQSVFVYNPDTNSADDILYRVDTLIEE